MEALRPAKLAGRMAGHAARGRPSTAAFFYYPSPEFARDNQARPLPGPRSRGRASYHQLRIFHWKLYGASAQRGPESLPRLYPGDLACDIL